MDALEAELTEVQIREWAAFASIEPFGAVAEWARAATIAAAAANADERLKRRVKPSDYMPDFERPATASAAVMSQRQIRQALRAVFDDRVKVPGE